MIGGSPIGGFAIGARLVIAAVSGATGTGALSSGATSAGTGFVEPYGSATLSAGVALAATGTQRLSGTSTLSSGAQLAGTGTMSQPVTGTGSLSAGARITPIAGAVGERVFRVEHWSNLACAGGERLGVLPLVTCSTQDTIDGVVATKSIKLEFVPDAYEHPSEVVPSTVLRAVYIDGAISDGAFDEYVIEMVDDMAGAGRGVVTVTGYDPLLILARERELLTQQYNGSVTAVLTDLLADGAPDEFAVGTVASDAVVLLDLKRATVQAGLQELGKQANNAADFVNLEHFEVRARRNGITNYLIDVVQVGVGAADLDIRLKKNLHSLRRRQNRGDNPTRLYITAQGQVIADAWFEVESVVNGTTFVAAVRGEPDLNPLLMDGAFTAQGLYIQTEAGDRFAITADIRATRRISIADTSSLSAGSFFRFIANSDGDPVEYLDIPDTRPVYAMFDAPFPPGTNWLPNADYSDWDGTGTAPVDWSHAVQGWEQEASNTLFGSAALAAGGTSNAYVLYPDGDGWAYPVPSPNVLGGRAFYCRAGDTITYAIWFKFIGTPGPTGNALQYVWNPAGGRDGTILVSGQPGITPIATVSDQWYEHSKSFVVEADGLTYFGWYTQKQASEWDFLLGGARVTVTPKGQTVPVGFFEGSPGAKAWVMGINRLLATVDTHNYEVQFRDLTRNDEDTNPYDLVTLGGLANVTAADLLDEALVLRVVNVERNELEPLDTKLTLASRRSTLTSQLFGAITFNQSSTTQAPQTVGYPVNLDPEEPPPPPPPPAPVNPHYWLSQNHPSIPNGHILPVPVDPDDDEKVLTASGGTVSWQPSGGTPTGDVSEILEVTAPDVSESSSAYNGNPIPFDTIAFQRGSGITLNGDGTVTVTEAGIYMASLAFFVSGATDATTVAGEIWAQDANKVLRNTERMPGNTLALQYTVAGPLRCAANEDINISMEVVSGSGTISIQSIEFNLYRVGSIPAP